MSDAANNNVISLDAYDSAGRKSGNAAAIKALQDIREQCHQRLAGNVRYMMSKCDDALYGCAQMAESRMVHDLYIDAIDELKAVGGDLEALFIDRFVDQFNLGIPRHVDPWSSSESGAEQGYADSAWRREEQASEDLAVCAMIEKTRDECAGILASLDRRIGFLIRDPDLELWQNPVGPEAVCEAFRTAVTATVSQLQYGYEIRPIVFNLFNEHVLGDMNAVYKELNIRLIKLGVQPQLPTDPQPPENNTAGPEPRDPPNAGQSGEVSVDVVAMMFERILDDNNIAGSMRALLGRLQIPLIKIAMRDARLFSDINHPARLLVRRLADSATGWDEHRGHDDPLYTKIDAIVRFVLNEADEDINLFSTLLADLEAFHVSEATQTGVDAQPSAKVLEGQARLEEARSSAMQQVEAHIDSGCQLDFVNHFVATRWRDLLLLIHARQGKDSEAWSQALSTMDELVWSVKPKHSSEEHQRLMTRQAALLNRLREGMHQLSVPVTEQDEFVARLRHAHASMAPALKPAAPEQDRHGADDRFVTQARQLQKGTWLEITGSDGKTQRIKLSWMSPITKTYLFTDQKGQNAGNYSIEDLARLFRCGRARRL